MFVNDVVDHSELSVRLTRSDGSRLAEVRRDGFRSCSDPPLAPTPGYDLGWRAGYYDLSALKGQNVRLVFENRNLRSGHSLGVWTVVDDVRLVDAGPEPEPPGPHRAYLPFTKSPPCDPVVYGVGARSVKGPPVP
jgi:hypothetical protein